MNSSGGRPMLPPLNTRADGSVASKACSSVVVVPLPLVPVTPSTGTGHSCKKRRVWLDTFNAATACSSQTRVQRRQTRRAEQQVEVDQVVEIAVADAPLLHALHRSGRGGGRRTRRRESGAHGESGPARGFPRRGREGQCAAGASVGSRLTLWGQRIFLAPLESQYAL